MGRDRWLCGKDTSRKSIVRKAAGKPTPHVIPDLPLPERTLTAAILNKATAIGQWSPAFSQWYSSGTGMILEPKKLITKGEGIIIKMRISRKPISYSCQGRRICIQPLGKLKFDFLMSFINLSNGSPICFSNWSLTSISESHETALISG